MDSTDDKPMTYDPDDVRRQWGNEVVGPDGESRAEARALILESLVDFRDDVIAAQDEGLIEPMQGFELRLRIHRERCALLGLGTAGERW